MLVNYLFIPDIFLSPLLPFLCPSYLPNSVIDSYLEPFTTYEYRVRGWNSFGRGSSDVTTVTTSEDKPWGVAPPRWSRLGERDDIIQLQWQTPARPNGVYACVRVCITKNPLLCRCGSAELTSVEGYSCINVDIGVKIYKTRCFISFMYREKSDFDYQK